MYSMQRVYDYQGQQPAILTDRLWPRGVRRNKLNGVQWCKTISPSTSLRQWFHQDRQQRYSEFCRRYRLELQQPEPLQQLENIRQLHHQYGQLLLLTASKDIAHSHVPILLAALQH